VGVAVAVALLVAVAVAVLVVRGGDGSDPPTSSPSPTTTTVPGEAAIDGPGPLSEPTRTWSAAIPAWDEGVMDLSADEHRVFVTTYPSEDTEMATVTAFAAADGTELWQRQVSYPWVGEPVAVPMGDDQVLLVGEEVGRYSELVDAATGEVVWRVAGKPAYDYRPWGGDGATVELASADPILLQRDEDASPIGTSAVDRETGDVLWQTDDEVAVPCGDVAVTLSWDYSGGVDVEPAVTSTGWDLRTGQELWRDDIEIGGCSDTEVAVGAVGGVEIRDVARGVEVDRVAIQGEPAGAVWGGMLHGDVLVASALIPGTEDDPRYRTVVVPRAGGAPMWDQVGPTLVEVADDHVLVRPRWDRVALVRLPGGEGAGEAPSAPQDAPCWGVLTPTTVLGCELESPIVTSATRGATLTEAWRVDVGAPAHRIAVGGRTLFVATAGGELVALR